MPAPWILTCAQVCLDPQKGYFPGLRSADADGMARPNTFLRPGLRKRPLLTPSAHA